MALVYTAETLISSARRMGMIPNTGAKGTSDNDILTVLTEMLWTKLVPNLMKIREEYYGAKTRLTIEGGVSSYELPSRAMLQKLRHIYYWDGASRRELSMIPHEDLAMYSSGDDIAGFYLEGNRIVIVPDLDPTATGYLELHFFSRPGSLILSSAARQVATVNIPSKSILLDANPPSSWAVSNLFDIHSSSSGAEGRVWDNYLDVIAPPGSPTLMTFRDPIDGSVFGTQEVREGDWVCPAGEAALPGIPVEYHPLLALATALRCAVSAGDIEVAKAHASEYSTDLQAMIGATESRVEGKPLKIRGHRGILRRM